MPKPVIITCAPTGGIHTPTMSEHLPITPIEIARAAAQRDRVAGFVDRARTSAEIAVGGQAGSGDGFFYQPTVVANAGRYGLASSVWTRDLSTGMKMSARLCYGMTWVNTHGMPPAKMPWAAIKGSGTGCDMSVYALDAYTSVRHVMVAH
jgi:aminobutyraldehyde dehydrogenase